MKFARSETLAETPVSASAGSAGERWRVGLKRRAKESLVVFIRGRANVPVSPPAGRPIPPPRDSSPSRRERRRTRTRSERSRRRRRRRLSPREGVVASSKIGRFPRAVARRATKKGEGGISSSSSSSSSRARCPARSARRSKPERRPSPSSGSAPRTETRSRRCTSARSTARRTLGRSPPGAIYETKSTFGKQDLSKNRSSSSCSFGSASRFLKPSGERAKRNPQVPGPGSYPAQTSIGKMVSSERQTGEAFSFGGATRDAAQKVFLSKAAAKVTANSDGPGPTAYEPQQSMGPQRSSSNVTEPTVSFPTAGRGRDPRPRAREEAAGRGAVPRPERGRRAGGVAEALDAAVRVREHDEGAPR